MDFKLMSFETAFIRKADVFSSARILIAQKVAGMAVSVSLKL